MNQPKKVRTKNPLAGKTFKTRYCQGDRTPSVVKKWNKHIRELKAKRKEARKANPELYTWEENKKRLKRPIETYSANHLYKLGCRERWLMDQVAVEARDQQRRAREKAAAALKDAGLPSVKTWKNAQPRTVRPRIKPELEVRNG